MKTSGRESTVEVLSPRDRLTGLGRLLAGHFGRFRTTELQDVAAKFARVDGERSVELRLVNWSISARSYAEVKLWLEPQGLLSRYRALGSVRRDASPDRYRLSILCPSRERPALLSRFVASVERTASHPERIEVLVYVDDDDQEREEYLRWQSELAPQTRLGGIEVLVAPPVGLGPAWNTLAGRSEGDFMMMGNDDQLYVSYGWDDRIDEVASACCTRWRDRLFCLWFAADEDTPTSSVDFPIVSREWVDAVGYFVPNIFRNWQNERWVFDLAFRVGRAVPVFGAVVQHRHYQDFQAPFDATYLRHRRNRETSEADAALMRETAGEREAEARKIESLIQRHDLQRKAVRTERFDPSRVEMNAMIGRFQAEGLDDQAAAMAEAGVAQGLWEHPKQRPERFVPGLKAEPLHDPSQFWFTSMLNERFGAMRAEARRFLDEQGLSKVDEALSTHGDWTQLVLYESGRRFERACALAPCVADVMSAIPEASSVGPGVVTLSRLEPGTIIAPHCGRTNASLRVHLPLWTDPEAKMTVGGREVRWKEGEIVVFDDSFEHSVHHRGSAARIVLLFDVWHPDLSTDERDRILARRSNTEQQIMDYMVQNDIEAVDLRDGRTTLQAGDRLAALIARHVDDPAVHRILLRGQQLHQERSGDHR